MITDSKINELKNNYEIAKKEREMLSNELEELDIKLKKLESELVSMSTKKKAADERKEYNKADRKRRIKIMLISLLTIVVIDLLFIGFSMFLTQMFLLILAHGSVEVVLTLMIRKMERKVGIIKQEDIDKLEKGYNDVSERRFTRGREYGVLRRNELESYKIYNEAKERQFEEIKLSSMDMSDIYRKIKVDKSFYSESKEVQMDIYDIKLKSYLIEKITHDENNKIDLSDLELLTVSELFTILTEIIPVTQHNKVLNHVIHSILGFAGNMQGYSVVWSEGTDEKLKERPEVTFDEQGKWDEFITHEDTNYKMIFETAHDILQNKIMKQTKHKKRSKNKI